jgi:hypothetical protein
MRDDQKPDFGGRILAIGLMYEKTITKVVIDLYWSALKDLELSEIETALQMHMRDPDKGRFMPKPADLRGFICRAPKSSVIAWAQVEKAMNKYDAYSTVQFEDGGINAVVKDLGGWPWLCSQNIDEPWTQKEFERRYEAYRNYGQSLNEPLLGIFEVSNRNNGYLEHIPDTVLITDSGEIRQLPPHLPKELPEAQRIVKLLAEKMDMRAKLGRMRVK